MSMGPSYWPGPTDEEQRTILIDVLLQYGLLAYTSDGLMIADEGRRVVEYFREKGFQFTPPNPDPKMLEALTRALRGSATAAADDPNDPLAVNRFVQALKKRREEKEAESENKPSPNPPGEG